ncbi:hypothetical protein Syun_006104 [Stephania yunnanensis]|uniref:Uncharacterized protein n=1 Tax=Stephania yunnanensis TaxID=152371 RepID=A0AAP0KVZ8_9MAGN
MALVGEQCTQCGAPMEHQISNAHWNSSGKGRREDEKEENKRDKRRGDGGDGVTDMKGNWWGEGGEDKGSRMGRTGGRKEWEEQMKF